MARLRPLLMGAAFLGSLLGARPAQAQLPLWHLASGKAVSFGSNGFDAAPTLAPAYSPATINPTALAAYPRPDGRPWFYMASNASRNEMRQVSTSNVVSVIGDLPLVPDAYYFLAGSARLRERNVAQKGNSMILPNLGVCNQFRVVYMTTVEEGTISGGATLPKTSYLGSATLNIHPTTGVASYAPATADLLIETQMAGGSIVAASGPDAGNNFYLAALCLASDPADSLSYPEMSQPPSLHPFLSKLVVYKISPTGGISLHKMMKVGPGLPTFSSSATALTLSRDGQRAAWLRTGNASLEVVYADLTQTGTPADRVRGISLFNYTTSKAVGLAFNPLNVDQLFVTGGVTTSNTNFNGLTTLDFATAFATPGGMPTATRLPNSQALARAQLVISYNGSLTAMYGTGSGSTMRRVSTSAAGALALGPNPLVTSFAVPRPQQIDGWNYNFLNFIDGPTSGIYTPPATTATVTFTGPSIRTVAGKQYGVYSWIIQGVGLPPEFTTGNPLTRTLNVANAPYTIKLATTLRGSCNNDIVGTTLERPLPIYSSEDPCPGCGGGDSRPAAPLNPASPGVAAGGLLALPTAATESFTITPAPNAVAAVGLTDASAWQVRVLDTYGQTVATRATYRAGDPISVAGWRLGMYQVLVTVPGQPVPYRLRIMVTR